MSLVHRSFGGEIPRSEPDLLPANAARLAKYCDLSTGSLRPLKGGLELATMLNNPVRGIYTEDGIFYFTWAAETYAFKAPVIDDLYNRVYFLTPGVGVFNVTTTLGMAADGPSPAPENTYRTGVPRPTVAPVLELLERTTLPDYPSIAVTAEAWWDIAGQAYGKADVSLTEVKALRQYTLNAPDVPVDAPEGTKYLTLKFIIKDTSSVAEPEVMSLVVRAGSTGRSSALPGGVEGSLIFEGGAGAGGTLNLEWGVTETRAYAYNNENTWKEEGAPSPASTISPTYLHDVQVTVAASDFTGLRPFSKFNIYRTFGTTPTYIKTDVTGAALVWVDSSRAPGATANALESTDWLPPPEGLAGIVQAPNGWFAAYRDNVLYMSEAYRPHAWPYNETFPTKIRGVCVGQGCLVVTCADGVYIVAGAYPSSASQMKLQLPQAGVAQRSMVGLEGVVAYASNDGIALVAGTQGSMQASQQLFTREKWRELYGDILLDASMRFSHHDGFLVASSHTQAKGFLMRLDDGPPAFSRFEDRYDCTFQLPVTDTLYYSVGNKVYQFRGGAVQPFDWWGRDHIGQMPTNLGAGYIRCDGPVTFTLYYDGVQRFEATLTTGTFRIPGGLKALRVSIRLRGTNAVHELVLARSMQGLRRVQG